MKWKKLGQLFCPVNIHSKLMSHAANPLPLHLKDDIYRVFYSGRDINNRSSVGYVDIDILTSEVIYIHKEPVFEFGSKDSFYSHGVSIGNSYEANGKRYILFMGWQYPEGGHWRGDIGRLVLNADWTLSLDSETPFISVDTIDPVSLSYPWVMRNKQGVYQMWYGSTLTWNAGNGEMLHVINHAQSFDGNVWEKTGQAIPSVLGVAQAFSHPTVSLNAAGEYDMWFSYRSGTGQTYRIGYANSRDAKVWQLRLGETGIDVSESGWDAEMIEYPFVFDHKGHRYILYNGNGNGKTGFGLAVIEYD